MKVPQIKPTTKLNTALRSLQDITAAQTVRRAPGMLTSFDARGVRQVASAAQRSTSSSQTIIPRWG
jgi:hypothetical protein